MKVQGQETIDTLVKILNKIDIKYRTLNDNKLHERVTDEEMLVLTTPITIRTCKSFNGNLRIMDLKFYEDVKKRNDVLESIMTRFDDYHDSNLLSILKGTLLEFRNSDTVIGVEELENPATPIYTD